MPSGLTTSSYGLEYRDTAKESYVTYDAAKAQESLDAYMAENSITDSSEITLTFAASDSEQDKKIAEAVANMYKNTLGITTDLQILPSLSFYDARREGTYDLHLGKWGADYADPATYFSIFLSSAIGQVNNSQYSDAEFDEMYDVANAEVDPAKRMEAFAPLEQKIMDDAAIIQFYQLNRAYLESEEYTSHHSLFQK